MPLRTPNFQRAQSLEELKRICEDWAVSLLAALRAAGVDV